MLKQLGPTDKERGEDCSTKGHSQEQGSGALLWQLALSRIQHTPRSVCEGKDAMPLTQAGKEHLLLLTMLKSHTSAPSVVLLGVQRLDKPHV